MGDITHITIHKVDGTLITVILDTIDAERIHGNLVHMLGGPGSHTSYVGIWDGHRIVHLHRWILGVQDNVEVDHWDRNGLNNQRSNLRICTRPKNAAAIQPQPNKTGFIGVREDTRCRKPRFDALVGGKLIGRFDTAEDAARARDHSVYERYGEFAILNFPVGR